MILQTPKQSNFVQALNCPCVRQTFDAFENTFVILHPFYHLNQQIISAFNYNDRFNKKEIGLASEIISWSRIIQEANLTDIKELDRLISFWHCALREADKTGWEKLMQTVHTKNYELPQVDEYPAVLTDATLSLLSDFGYHSIFLYPEFGEPIKSFHLQELINSAARIPYSNPRILTPDHQILFATDFDKCFTYLSGNTKTIEIIINKLGLEGFYCDAATKADWSFEEQTDNLINLASPERKKNYAG